jgi:hypothetical protein
MLYFLQVLIFCAGWMLPSLVHGGDKVIALSLAQCFAVVVFALMIYAFGYVKREN